MTAANPGLNADPSSTTVTFDDDFTTFVSSPDVGAAGWMTEFFWGQRDSQGAAAWDSETEYYSDSSVGINPFRDQNGILTITAAPATPGISTPAGSGDTYTSGLMTTYNSFSQLYGYFEVRAKLPGGVGMWPAFWLLPTSGAWPPELDVFEFFGASSTTAVETSHYSDGTGANLGTEFFTNVPSATTTFNTYGVDWEQNTITWYVNGVAVAQTPTPADMDTPMYMLLNLAVGAADDTLVGAADGQTAQMQIEYVRAYSSLNGGSPQLVTVAYYLANCSTLNGTPFSISDTAANIVANLSVLNANAGEISSITLTNGTVQVSVATFLANTAVLALIGSEVVIANTAANFVANLSAPNAAAGEISSITLTSGNVQVSASTLLPNTAVPTLVRSGVVIADTAANVSANLSVLNADAGEISTITLTSGTVQVSVATFLANPAVLALIGSGVVIADTAENIAANLSVLNADGGEISSITLTSGTVQVSVATFLANTAALTLLGSGVVIADTAANVSSNLAALNNVIVSAIVLGAGPQSLTVTAADATADPSVLAEISAPGGLTIHVVDTAAEVATLTTADIAALQAGGATVVVAGSRPDGSVDVHSYAPGETWFDLSYASEVDFYSASGQIVSSTYYDATGAVVGDQTFDGASGYTISIDGSGEAIDLSGDGAVAMTGSNDPLAVAGGTGNVIILATTNHSRYTVSGDNCKFNLSAAQASIIGSNDQVGLDGSALGAVSLYETNGVWDTVTGSNGNITVNCSQASILGGNDQIYLDGSSSDAVSLYDTCGAWDTVNGSNGSVTLTNAEASVFGGNDWVYLDGSSSDAVSLYSTGGAWDTVTGSDGSVTLTAAQASILGSNDWIYLDGSASDAVSLYDTYDAWDTVIGSNGCVTLTSAQASIIGGGETVYLNGPSSDAVSLYATDGNWDVLYGSNAAVTLNGSQATVIGSNDTVYLNSGSTTTLNGSGENLVLQQASYGNIWVCGFNSSDVLTFSESDWSSFSALLSSGNITQSGANTIIRLDASDSVTLYNVTMSSISPSQFKFV